MSLENSQKRILTAQGLFKSYRMGAARIEVLKGVDISVRKGEFLAVLGASGSGKSTLLHTLGTLDRPDRGTVAFHGCDLYSLPSRHLYRFRNRSVGFVFQFYHLLDELTVLENVMLPAMIATGVLGWIRSRAAARRRAAQLVERLGLAHRAAHRPYQLSGGERQRVAIGRALMNEPELLLADEPTGNLDCDTGNGILELLAELNGSGQTVVMVTHDQAVAGRACRTVTLVDGRLRAD